MPRISQDRLTRAGMMVQQAAGNVPVIIKAFQASPTADPKVDVTLLPAIDPAKVVGYRVDESRDIMYPVLADNSRSRAPYLSGLDYTPTTAFGHTGNDAFLGGLWMMAKRAVSFVKTRLSTKLRQPLRRLRIRKPTQAMRVKRAARKQFSRSQWLQITKTAGTPASPLKQKGFLEALSTADFMELVQSAGQGGLIPPGIQELSAAQAAAGDIDGATDTLRTADPNIFGPKPSERPAWLIPVALVGGVFLFTQYKKGKKRS